MKSRAHQVFAICFAMIAPVAVVAATPATAVETTDLQPFTRIAYIPAGADVSSIRFEGVKAVKVATKRIATTDSEYCGEGYQEPGGSAYCPSTQDASPVPAYQVTYSFSGPSMGSDEYGSTRFTFSVYVNPDDLSPAARQAISARKISRTDTAGFFALTTVQGGLAQQVSVDEQNSTFCAGSYADGLWTRTDPNCEDKVVYKTVAVPSGYTSVKVEPASPRFERPVTAE
jgi:hypothetical protein